MITAYGADELGRFAELLDRAASPAGKEHVLRRALRWLGIDGHDFFAAPRRGTALPHPGESLYARTTLPNDLDTVYFEKGWYDRCPVVALSFGPPRPILARDLYAGFPHRSIEREMQEATRSFGIENELFVPLSDVNRLRQINLFMTGRGRDTAQHFEAVSHKAAALAQVFLWSYEDAALAGGTASAPVALTPREAECLQWAAEGLTTDAIADRMGISARTVKFHTANAAGKLGARTRTEAVARAVARGLLAAG